MPSVGRLLAAQIGYQARLLASGRAVTIGIGLPVILLIASHGSHAPDQRRRLRRLGRLRSHPHRLEHLRRAPGRGPGGRRPQAVAGHAAAAVVLLPRPDRRHRRRGRGRRRGHGRGRGPAVPHPPDASGRCPRRARGAFVFGALRLGRRATAVTAVIPTVEAAAPDVPAHLLP